MTGASAWSFSPDASAACTATSACENRFAEDDQRQQAVTFCDVMRVPRGGCGALGPHRNNELQCGEENEAWRPQLRHEQHRDPRHLKHRNAHRIPARGRFPCGIGGCRPQPLRDDGQSHHDVPADGGDVGRAGLEHRGYAGRQNQRAGNLHEDREAIGDVITVVRRGEPGEVHPGPPDGKEDHQVSDEPVEGVGLGDGVVQATGRLGDGDDEDQVEEELEGVAAR